MKYREGFKRLVMFFMAAVLMMIPVTAIAATRLETTEEAYWDANQKGVAHWKRVAHAWEYQIRLYEDGNSFVKTVTTKGTKVDLSEYMRDGTSYIFSVRAVPKTSQRTYISSEWKDSDFLDMEGLGENEGRWRTYSQGKKYQREDGSFITGQWERIQSKWYCFNQDGYALSGWQQIDSKWYYLDKEGVMQTGWLELDGAWYFLNNDGAMAIGWKEVKPGEWYYMDSSGKMLTDTVIDGCTLDHSGKWIS